MIGDYLNTILVNPYFSGNWEAFISALLVVLLLFTILSFWRY